MSFWREAGLPLRLLWRSTPHGGVLGQSRRFLYDSIPRPQQQQQIFRKSTSSSVQWPTTRRNNVAWRLGRLGANQVRSFSATARAQHGNLTPPKPGEEINVSFVDKDGQKTDFQVAEGDNLLDIAQANDLEMEGAHPEEAQDGDAMRVRLTRIGACGGSCACSTCHVIIEDPAMFDKMEEPSDDENDMLDLAFGLQETSRLGCQVPMSKDLDGMVVRLPSSTRNLQAKDFE